MTVCRTPFDETCWRCRMENPLTAIRPDGRQSRTMCLPCWDRESQLMHENCDKPGLGICPSGTGNADEKLASFYFGPVNTLGPSRRSRIHLVVLSAEDRFLAKGI